ncbi:uncharacterized protein DNG_03088 [Cephalotrichum gorgonifer]|uniref:BPL/LPL catalytic domain-containing protein n=1 Tax=Cephalotrichum gorgonifer TaxID=2041049 RepID=A0AAE8ST90_9PEZI|nr:uncharacterized protein DNG_03088 [Cephalotrichum gorgonifer]
MLTRRIARRIIPRGRTGTAHHHHHHHHQNHRLPRATTRHLHLHRVHLPSQHPTYTPYALATSLQESLAAPHHAYKAAPETADGARDLAPPQPSLLSFTPAPTYTLGRRQRTLDGEVEGALTAPLRVSSPTEWSSSSSEGGNDDPGSGRGSQITLTPFVTHSPRGGLTTYHGPGQLVLWPTLDLRSPLHPHLTVRSYARLLEDTTSHLLRTLYGIEAVLDPENPGVWARRPAGGSEIRKIAAMGIHLRRHVATLGIALNLTTPVSGAGDVNPWARFVPCGIEGREVTSVEAEGGEGRRGEFGGRGLLEGEVVAGLWADEFVRRLERGDGE